jgi:hypothetical protein
MDRVKPKDDRTSLRLRFSLLVLATATATLFLTAPAAPAAGPYALEIETFTGSGYGEVLCKVGSGPAEECEWEYETSVKLTLVPFPEAESEFAGFRNGTGSASACTGTGPCTFTLKADSYVEAPFELAYRSLAISLKGQGEGEVFCALEGGPPEGCEDEYPLGTELTLSGEAEASSEFAGFQNGKGSGAACIGTEPCTLVLQSNSTLEARFEPIRHLLSIAKTGSGQGTVSCNGTTCAPSYPEGSEVVLTATPAAGSAFAGFSGEGCSGTGACTVWVEGADVAVSASFGALPAPVQVAAAASPPAPGRCRVPRLAGKSLRAARATLAAASCSIGRVRRPSHKHGRARGPLVVGSSMPGPGALLPVGSRVGLRLIAARRGR